MVVKKISKILVVVIGLCLCAAILPNEASAAVFAEKKPEGLMANASNGRIAVTWEKVSKAETYTVYRNMRKLGVDNAGQTALGQTKNSIVRKLKYKRLVTTKKNKVILKNCAKGYEYSFYVVAKRKVVADGAKKTERTQKSNIRSTTVPLNGKSTIKNLLRTGISPIGSTMYIWGGGWNGFAGNNKAQKFKTGLSSKWRSFARKHKKNYNYAKYLLQREKGLDCSGFVGNCVYNVMQTADGKQSYVTSSFREGKYYASLGFGKYVARNRVNNRKAGDVMTCSSHVWICLGECTDGSAVVLHSSPPMVSLAGTPARNGASNSKAIKLAKKYMKKYYPDLYKYYPNSVYRGSVYNTSYGRMRWSRNVLADPEGYTNKTANAVLKDLFSERELPVK